MRILCYNLHGTDCWVDPPLASLLTVERQRASTQRCPHTRAGTTCDWLSFRRLRRRSGLMSHIWDDSRFQTSIFHASPSIARGALNGPKSWIIVKMISEKDSSSMTQGKISNIACLEVPAGIRSRACWDLLLSPPDLHPLSWSLMDDCPSCRRLASCSVDTARIGRYTAAVAPLNCNQLQVGGC